MGEGLYDANEVIRCRIPDKFCLRGTHPMPGNQANRVYPDFKDNFGGFSLPISFISAKMITHDRFHWR